MEERIDFQDIQKTLQQSLEQSINLRLKYPTQPQKFFTPEEHISQSLQKLQQNLSSDVLPYLIRTHIPTILLKLLQHPNPDILSNVISVIHQIIVQNQPQTDALNQQSDKIYEIYYMLCINLEERNLLVTLTQILTNTQVFDESIPQEYQSVFKILKIIESMLQIHPEHSARVVNRTQCSILMYLADRIMPNYRVQNRVIDDSKYVSSDLLVIMLQSGGPQVVQKFIKIHGVEVLVQCLKFYEERFSKPQKNQKKDNQYTQTSDEFQYISNLFDSLNLMLASQSNFIPIRQFYAIQSIRMLIWFIKQKNQHSILALKTLRSSLTDIQVHSEDDYQWASGPRIAHQLIENGLLKYIFAILMKKGLKGKQVDQQLEIDQNCLQIIYYLVKRVQKKSIYEQRLITKLNEDRFQKLQEIFEMRQDYIQEIKLGQDNQKQLEQYINSLKEGLVIVEVTTKILLILLDNKRLKKRILQLFSIHSISPEEVEHIISKHYKFIKDGKQKNTLQKLLSYHIPLLRQTYGLSKQ